MGSTDDENTCRASRSHQENTEVPGSDGRGSVEQETAVTVRNFLNAFDSDSEDKHVAAGSRWGFYQDRLSMFLSYLLDLGWFLSCNNRSHYL